MINLYFNQDFAMLGSNLNAIISEVVICIAFNMLSTVYSMDLYVSNSGQDLAECGNSYPCKSIQYTLDKSLEGDVVILTDKYYNHCAVHSLTHSLIFQGIADEQGHIPQIGCGDIYLADMLDNTSNTFLSKERQEILQKFKIIFEIFAASVIFQNVFFQHGSVIFHDGVLTLKDCKVGNVNFYFMETVQAEGFTYDAYKTDNVGNSFYHETIVDNIITNHYFYDLEDWTELELRDYYGLDESAFVLCKQVEVVFDNVTFYYSGKKDLHQGYWISGNKGFVGLNFLCRDTFLTINNTFLADIAINVYSTDHLYFAMTNSSFVGIENRGHLQGGLRFFLLKNMEAYIENCRFLNLTGIGYLVDLFNLVFDDRQFNRLKTPTSAIFIQFPYKTIDTPTHIHKRTFTFLNSVMEGNRGGISCIDQGNYDNFIPNLIKIEGSRFAHNHALSNGGSIYGYACDFFITESLFTDNSAGILPFDILSNIQKTEKLLIFLNGYFFNVTNIEYHDLHFYYTFTRKDIVDSANPESKREFTLNAKGGALYFDQCRLLKIWNSHFRNNDAIDKGGSLYLMSYGTMSLESCDFIDDIISQSQSTIYTQGDLKIKSLNLHVGPSILGEKYALLCTTIKSENLKLQSANIQCSQGAKFINLNVTDKGFVKLYRHDSYLSFKDVSYSCSLCPEDKYSLSGGGLDVACENASFTVYQKDITCHSCPYEGICHGYIKSKPGYWGKAQEGIVSFYKCPPNYCCMETDCGSYNKCHGKRHGTLCGRCKTGFSESLLSKICVENEQCSALPVVVISLLMSLAYALFLLLKSTEKVTRQKVSTTKNVVHPFAHEGNDQAGAKTKKQDHASQNDTKGSTFAMMLIIYYLQDASIIHLKPHVANDKQNFMTGVFSFGIEIMQFIDNLCFVPNSTPLVNTLLKLSFVPQLFIVLFVFCFIRPIVRKIPILKDISVNFSLAILFAILFSYQTVATGVLSMIYCVPLYTQSVLFLDGNIQCFQFWQYVLMAYIIFCILPFGTYILLLTSHLQKGYMKNSFFLIGCIFPIPTIILSFGNILKKKRHGEDRVINGGNISLYDSLQGPYNDLSFRLFERRIPYCWAGLLLQRRLALILIYSYCHDLAYRLILMTIVCLCYLFLRIYVQPCKESMANLAGSLSSLALVIISMINLIRAIFDFTEHVENERSSQFLSTLDSAEDVLLVWLPLIVIFVLIMINFWNRLLSLNSSKKSKG